MYIRFGVLAVSASYIGGTTGSVLIDHLKRNLQCKELCNKLSFKIIDQAKSEFHLKI